MNILVLPGDIESFYRRVQNFFCTTCIPAVFLEYDCLDLRVRFLKDFPVT